MAGPELGVSRFTYDPGTRMPWGHRHKVFCIGGRKPEGRDSERFPDFWP